MTAPYGPSAVQLEEDREAFRRSFERHWARAAGTPGPVLIDWDRAFRDHDKMKIPGEAAVQLQLLDLAREASYLMSQEQRRALFRPRRMGR